MLCSVTGTTTLDREWHIYTRSSKLNKTGSNNKIVTYFLSIADSFSPIFSCTPNYLTSISTCWRLTYVKHMCLVHVVWDFPEDWFVLLWLIFWAPLFLWFCTIGWWFSRPLLGDLVHHLLIEIHQRSYSYCCYYWFYPPLCLCRWCFSQPLMFAWLVILSTIFVCVSGNFCQPLLFKTRR